MLNLFICNVLFIMYVDTNVILTSLNIINIEILHRKKYVTLCPLTVNMSRDSDSYS